MTVVAVFFKAEKKLPVTEIRFSEPGQQTHFLGGPSCLAIQKSSISRLHVVNAS